MVLTPILYLEIGIATLIAVGVLWTRIEYGLFLYAFALGFPDVALPVGDAINVRVDDVLILMFLVRSLLWTAPSLSKNQKSIFKWQAVFFALCILSIAVESALGNPPGAYEPAKMAGCAVIFLVLPRLLQSERRFQFFISGLMCGGIALALQIRMHLGDNSAANIANFQELKSAATFSTWNPNTIGQAAILLVFGAGLGAVLFSKSSMGKMVWAAVAIGFALVPAMVFVRGTTLSIVVGIVAFLILSRQWKWVLAFATVCVCALLLIHARQPELMEDATSVNVSTGEGFSHRFDRWGMAFRAIEAKPVIGQGFGQELPYLLLIGSEGRAHDAYLAVWLELGMGGLLLFLIVIFQFTRAATILFRSVRFGSQGALILALILTLCLDSIALPTLYWEKLPTIAMSLALALVGLCERDVSPEQLKEIQWNNFQQFAPRM
ncbi:MAG TPA: O-antigen ligase family protein [Candidatus Acidoferrales bacterium]|jgi:O-antigen ligase|nr:O-antigen ligase family protein [Candidatus Acidoferrales bacterium]